MNKVLVQGDVLDITDVELFGKRVSGITVETKEKYKDKQGQVKSWSTRIKCTYDDSVHGEVKKGDNVLIEGKLSVRSTETDRGKVYITEVRTEQLTVLHAPEITSPNYAEQPF